MTAALPSQLFLEVTRACNQRCPFCSCPWFGREGDGGLPELSIDEWQAAVDELVAHGVRHIAVTGGEPTLKEGLPSLLRHIAARLQACAPEPTTLALFTNGRTLDGAWLDLLAACRAELYVSLPGLTTFAMQTGGATAGFGFRQLLELIHAASAVTRVSVGVTVTRPLLPELHATLAYAVLSGAHAVILNLFKPTGRGRHHPDLELSSAQVIEAADIAEDVAEKCGGACVFGGEFPPEVTPSTHPHLQVENRCMAARGTFTIAPDGRLHVCEHDETPLAPWREWRAAIQSPRWRQFAAAACTVCPLLHKQEKRN